MPRGVVEDPTAKGFLRYEKHIRRDRDIEVGASEGPCVDKAPEDKELNDEEAMHKVERKVNP